MASWLARHTAHQLSQQSVHHYQLGQYDALVSAAPVAAIRDISGALARNETMRAIQRPGRSIWTAWGGYHRRSLVERRMRYFKLLGERVMARTFDRQVAKLKVRAGLLNHFTALGRPQTVAMA